MNDRIDEAARQPLAVLRRGRYLFASRGDVPHPRRVIDGALLFVGVAGLVVWSLVGADNSIDESPVADALDRLLGWLEPLWTLIYEAAWFLALATIVVSFVSRRIRLGRDLLVAAAVVVIAGVVLEHPSVRIGLLTAVVVVARPDLIRPARRLTTWVLLLAAAGAVVAGTTTPSSMLAGLSLGLASGALVRLALGSSAGFPDEDRVLRGLDELGLTVVDLQRAPHQPPGVATYLGQDVSGTAFQVKVYGSDARDAQFLAGVWRSLSYRDAGPAVGYSRLQQVEHESLVILLASRGEVPVPTVLAAGAADSGDALLVTSRYEGRLLDELEESAVGGVLADLWDAVGQLRRASIAHGRLNARAVVVDNGRPMIVDFAAGRTSAPASALATDVAELLVSTALKIGAEPALRAAIDQVGSEAVAASLPYLQRAALTPWLRDEVRRRRFKLDDLRQLAAGETGTQLPEIAELRRVSLRDIAFVALTAFAAYLLISQFADIGFDVIWEELSSAEWPWLVVTLAVAQLIYLTQAIAVQGAVTSPLPYGPTVALQSALKFIGLTVPSAAGRIAVTLRYLQRLGVAPAAALTSSALDGVAGSIVEVVLFLCIIPFVDFDLDLSTTGSDYSGLVWLGLALIALGVLAVIVGFALPRVRARVMPHLRAAWRSLIDVVRSPRQLALLMGGNLGNELVNAVALSAAVHAYGADVTIAETLFIAMGVTLFTSIVPIPGGIGVAEAALTTGLVAVGVPEAQAFAGALTYRLATYYLPPIWGYFSLRWLGERGYV